MNSWTQMCSPDGQYECGDSDCGECLHLVQHHRLVREFDQRLRLGECEGTETRAVATDQDQSLHADHWKEQENERKAEEQGQNHNIPKQWTLKEYIEIHT